MPKASIPIDPAKSLTDLLQECRMVLPGIQALFGFQLVILYEPAFRQLLSRSEQIAHFAAILTVAVAVGLVTAPAAFHRLSEPTAVSMSLLRLAAGLLGVGMGFLLAGMTIDIYLIGRVILASAFLAAVLTAGIGAILAALWFVFPLMRARSRTVK